MSINPFEERLIIVPDDEDDYEIEEFGTFDITKTATNLNKCDKKDKQSNTQTPSIYDFDAAESESSTPSKPKASSKSRAKLLKKCTSKTKICRTNSSPFPVIPSDNLDVPYVTFDNISNILTISRMGSIYYCVEDLYSKIYMSLCTLDQFVDFLTKPRNFVLKQVTLTEKMFITQHSPKIKSYTSTRYRLFPIDGSDYLLKLKQLLTEYSLKDIVSQLEIYLLNKANTKMMPAQSKPSPTISSDKNVNESSISIDLAEKLFSERSFSTPSPTMPMIVNVEENVQITNQNELISKSSSQIQRQLHRNSLNPYPPIGSEIDQSTICQSINLSQAILEHKQTDFYKLPKLFIRHRKSYATKMIEIMGELFPTWFIPPTYRCIHCFTCDQVYTPQSFMVHTDDKRFVDKKPLKITSIELLTSERLSPSKVKLWNVFCTNLMSHAKEGRIDGF